MTTQTTHTLSIVTPIVAAIIVAVALLVATSQATQEMSNYITLRTQQVRNEAIDNCAHNSKYVYTETADKLTKVTEEPSQNSYAECLKLKNVK